MMKKTHHYYNMISENQDNILFPWKNSPTIPGIIPFFTTRHGGVSQENWSSFNLGDHVGDQPEHVLRNRTILLSSLVQLQARLALVNQVHGDRVVRADQSRPRPDADAIITDQPNIVLGILTADCVPVLFADPKQRLIGAAHAGWRGAAAGILENTVSALETLGAHRSQLHAIIGPCIGAAHYEVDRNFLEELLKVSKNKINHEWQKFFSNAEKPDKMCFDLAGYVHARLIKTGIEAFNIINLEQCTYALESLFFSHRRAHHRHQNPCGRQMAGIFMLSDP